jgi:hypothetical protein
METLKLLEPIRESPDLKHGIFYLGFLAGAIVSLFLLLVEVVVWEHFLQLQNCPKSVYPVICGHGEFVFFYAQNRLQSISYYFLSISDWGVASLVLVASLLFTLAYCTRAPRWMTVGVLITLAAFELSVYSWAVLLVGSSPSYAPLNIPVFVPSFGIIQYTFRNGFVGQDLEMLILFVCLAAAALCRFGLRGSLQVSSLALAILPISIYAVDRGDFGLHFEAAFPSFYWLTNLSLLEICVAIFALSTVWMGVSMRRNRNVSNRKLIEKPLDVPS